MKSAGCEKIFAEKLSSVAQRLQLETAIDYAREGDALVVTKLDRLARSVAHLVAIGERLDAKGVSLKVLEQAIDTSTSTGRLMFNMLGAIAQFERELMLERQREGVAKAKLEGKYKGRHLQLGLRLPRCVVCTVNASAPPRLPSDCGSAGQASIAY